MSPPRSYRSSETLDTLSSSRRPTTPSRNNSNNGYANDGPGSSNPNPTYATFSPTTLSSTAPSATTAAKRRSTILVHQKSPLLLATPPQITRALAYSHPFLLPLNRFTGLITWTTGDPWESFLMLVVFWASVLYGDIVVRMAGPVVLVLILIGGMYGRRFSPLSSSGRSEPGLGTGDGAALGPDAKTGKKTNKSKNLSVDGLPVKEEKGGGAAGAPSTAAGGHRRNQGSISEITNTRHQKTLDEIVETLKELTARCNILLEPLLELTDFLSTQRTPTSATTRPALTTLFVRILLCTPVWVLLTLPPLRIITTQRVVFLLGTLILTWHARVMRVARSILWRSATVRRLLALVTGLAIESHTKVSTGTPGTQLSAESSSVSTTNSAGTKTFSSAANGPRESELTKALRRSRGGHDAGVRFTFIIYENQRRWVGLGWTSTLFSYERPAWTDEHNNNVPPRDEFELPEVEDGSNMRWRWVEGSRWRVDGVPDDAVMAGDKDKEWDYDGPGGRMGWVFYDNKWQNGRRGQDGWGRWTRRRKWYRDAELVEADELVDEQPLTTQSLTPSLAPSLISTDSSMAKQKQATDNNPPPRSPDMVYPGAPTSHNSQSTTGPRNITEVVGAGHDAGIKTGGLRKETSNKEDDEAAEQDDTVSMLSTSSKSFRFSGSGGGSWRGKILPSSSVPTVDSGKKGSGTGSTSRSSRSRRTSNATMSEDEAAGLGTEVSLALQDAGKEGGSWGIGDEVRMGLE
ncbi:integral peroxisomal membrane peroxin-domain-containing protein [Rhypophila decipiens]|uniref:Integral peroxisomal membrane peroxin-domain-containing protein n=1 Tax=Rhypophila decipiens TaxID=261697 RepID=A0AAN6Y5B5_9PEZI|nr:integral peroxisomal membrane peroxin-domain-containing protein [Rhypophila decipiens]